ncbi:pirin family protein [Salinibacterium sp. M195]|uniref:pirin family protein n=1 Tax=Salinibacterium sp. M195 TaxID=2583374 RepID=UPI001C63A743|nr:pirin family protein [Salinibacterium sp. M195]QYH35236.1 pirin family protein [Salinibacterium sp. M195]
MSNPEKNPAEVLCETQQGAGVQLLTPREVPLGGPRAMNVRRTLPQRSRSLIGGWCFIDHYGPETTRMHVPPHPHTGLQTVSWLFAGDIEHRDSVGSLATVRPGELNLMTAGHGISHSEVSPSEPTLLHGAQLWVALPDAHRNTAPAFENYAPTPFEHQGAALSVFIGELAGVSSPARVFSPLLGAQLDVPAGTSITLTLDASFEHGVLVDTGDVTIANVATPTDHLAYLAPGLTELTITATTDARLLLLGGEPLGESIIMWWNFIGRSHDEIVEYRAQWQADVIDGGNPAGRFGTVANFDGHPLPAPELPTIRLKPRD